MKKGVWIVVVIIVIFLILAGIFLVNQKSSNLEKKYDVCIENLSVLEETFDISRSSLSILESNCSTCSPWYSPQVAKFSAIVEKNGKEYILFFSNTCRRHQNDLIKYCISSKQKDEVYIKSKQKICGNIAYFDSDMGTKLCDPEITDRVNDTDSFINCLEEFHLMNGINITEGKRLCVSECIANNNSCLISCFEEYVEKSRSALFDIWCNQYEKLEVDKVTFSVEYPAGSDGWQNISIGENCNINS